MVSGKPGELLHQFNHSHPTILNLLVGVVFTIVTLISIEGVFYVLRRVGHLDSQETLVASGELYRHDELLGASPRPNAQVSVTKKLGNKTVYDVTYSIDEYGRRVIPMTNPDHRTKFILFFGGSYTFGEGVNDNETMPFYVSQFASKYKPYNYGFRGYGPQQMLAKLQDGEISKEIDEAEGILIYTFIDHHVNRAIGSMQIYEMAMGGHYPYYVIDDNDKLIKKGDLTSGRPVVAAVYRLLTMSQILAYFQIDIPKINDNHIRLTAKIIEESRNTFEEEFESDSFYVLFYPGSKYSQKMIPYLKDADVKYLDYSKLIDTTSLDFHIEGDGHPTAQAFETVAAKLVKSLEIADEFETRSPGQQDQADVGLASP
jgi:hypothetical protein